MTEVNGVPVLTEGPRGCGHRKTGGLYLMSADFVAPCCLGVIPIRSCPECDRAGLTCGLKPSRGWTWLRPHPFLEKALRDGDVGVECRSCPPIPETLEDEIVRCGTCHGTTRHPQCHGSPESLMCSLYQMAMSWKDDQQCGLLWIGEKFYPTPKDFLDEVRTQGLSRRLSAVPNGFKVGETWVLSAHRKAITRPVEDGWEHDPGIIYVCRPKSIQQVVSREQAQDDEFLEKIRKRGIDPVIVDPVDDEGQPALFDDGGEEEGEHL